MRRSASDSSLAIHSKPGCAARSPGFLFLGLLTNERESDVELKERLTAREADVLRLLARGRTYAQAAEDLGMSAHTVATHVKNAYRKLDVHNAAAAVLQAVRLGLIL